MDFADVGSLRIKKEKHKMNKTKEGNDDNICDY